MTYLQIPQKKKIIAMEVEVKKKSCCQKDGKVTCNIFLIGQRLHCKPGQVEPAYIACGNGAVAMQVSQVILFELDPTKFK